MTEMQTWPNCGFRGVVRTGMWQERGTNIRKQGQSQSGGTFVPQLVGSPRLDSQNNDRKCYRDSCHWDVQQQPQRGGDGTDVRSRLNNVGDQKPEHQRVKQPARVVIADHTCNSFSGNHAQLRAQVNCGRHHWESDGGSPQERKTEGSSGLRVRANGAGVIIRCAADAAGKTRAPEASKPLTWRSGTVVFDQDGTRGRFGIGVHARSFWERHWR